MVEFIKVANSVMFNALKIEHRLPPPEKSIQLGSTGRKSQSKPNLSLFQRQSTCPALIYGTMLHSTVIRIYYVHSAVGLQPINYRISSNSAEF